MFRTLFFSFLAVCACNLGGCSQSTSKESSLESKPDSVVAENQGLTGGFYQGDDLTRFDGVNVLENLDAAWDEINGRGGNWSAQWEGYITAPTSGQITFAAECNRDLIVKIAGKEVLHTGEGNSLNEGKLNVKKDKQYHINIIYLQKTGGSTYFRIFWGWEGQEKQLVPLEALNFSKEQDEYWKDWLSPGGEVFDYTSNIFNESDPIRIVAPEFASLNFDLSTGGLPVAPGLETYTVCRADREHPEKAEGLGYTYQHHQDIAVWHGRMYVGWNTCEKDEDVWPNREVYSTSENGKNWAKPKEMFPQGVSTPLRMYFFLAPNGRMLIIAGLRENYENLSERKKSGVVVREIHSDHTLGDVFTLRGFGQPVPNQPPMFDTSGDKIFVEACRQLLSDHIYLHQQDYGNLLDPEQRIPWTDPKNWAGNDKLKDAAIEFGKAMCFFERKDGTMIAVAKRRWVMVSNDGGKTWQQPVRPASLITGGGKVWGQQTSDGRYVLVYSPDLQKRWPLAMLTSDDGITFSNPHALHGEIPKLRYEGKFKDPGASYHRGLSKWNNDGTWKDKDFWMVFSINKEDIVVVHLPIPFKK